MQFLKDGDVYKVARMTGSQDNILGITFSENEVPVDVVEWVVKQGAVLKSSSPQVLEQAAFDIPVFSDRTSASILDNTTVHFP